MNVLTAPALRAPLTRNTTPKSKDLDPENFSWADAGRGLVGAVSSAVIYGAGITLDTLVRAPQALYHAEKGLYQTERLGPVIKCTLAPLLLCGAIAAPVAAVLGGTGYGLYKGFVAAAENGVVESAKDAVKDLKQMHEEGFSKRLIQGIQDLAAQPLPEGEQPFDISIGGGAKGLVGATVGTAVDGVGIGAITLLEAPRAFYKVNKAIWESEAALPLKTIGTVLTLPATPLAVGLGVVGGALYGMGRGAASGYTDGLTESVKQSGRNLKDYYELVDGALDKL